MKPDFNLQALVDGMNAQWQRERAESQMTLGSLISTLETLPADTLIGLYEPHSYRGYYSDLAFEPSEERVSAAALLAMCREAMGQVFTGYKGGEFVMGARTPVWVAYYGCCGKRLLAVNADGSIAAEVEHD